MNQTDMEAEASFEAERPARRGLSHKLARWAAMFAMGSWLFVGLVPVVVVVCALR